MTEDTPQPDEAETELSMLCPTCEGQGTVMKARFAILEDEPGSLGAPEECETCRAGQFVSAVRGPGVPQHRRSAGPRARCLQPPPRLVRSTEAGVRDSHRNTTIPPDL